MNPEPIKNALTAKPFRPFRLTFGSGNHIDVHHPELAIMGPAGRTAVVYTGKVFPDQGEEMRIIDIMLIESIDFLPRRGNGKRKAS